MEHAVLSALIHDLEVCGHARSYLKKKVQLSFVDSARQLTCLYAFDFVKASVLC